MRMIAPVMIPLLLPDTGLAGTKWNLCSHAFLASTFTAIMMLVRQASPAGVPEWQPCLGLIGVVVATLVIAWIASRIFRVAILAQGKTPTLAELVRWGLRTRE